MVIFNMHVGCSINSINRSFRMSIDEFNMELEINGNAQLGLLASANHVTIRVRNLLKNKIFGEELL